MSALSPLRQPLPMFPEIDGLDRSILERLGEIQEFGREKPIIAICQINLPPDDVTRMGREQYALYLFTRTETGAPITGSVRTEPPEGKKGSAIALRVMEKTLDAFGCGKAEVRRFHFHTTEAP